MNKNNLKTPSELVVTACLSSGLSIILTLISIVVCILALIYRYECLVGVLTNRNGAEYFLVTILRVYILHEDCTTSLHLDNLTKANSIFILAIIILVFAVINLLTAIALLSVVNQEDAAKNLDIIAYIHVGACLASLVVDLTLGVHFGMDYKALSDILVLNSPGLAMNYEMDIIRLGAFLLMTVSLKGYIAHAINIVLLVLLMYYIVEYKRKVNENEHPIHKLGVLNAFDHPKKLEDPWNGQRNDVFSGYPRGSSMNPNDEEPHRTQMRDNPLSLENSNPPKRLEDPWQLHRNDNMFMGYGKGPQVNPAFEEEPSRPPLRGNPLPDYNRNNKRSDSWLQNQISSGPGLGSRPFSYLEEPKRPIPVKSPTTPTNEPQWRRDVWPPAPPVPDPDYSPPPRRLKSALKSNYS